MRMLNSNEVTAVSGGGGPGGAVAGGVIAGVEYIAANAGSRSWHTGTFILQVGAGVVTGFLAPVTALRAIWGFNGAVALGTSERIIEGTSR
jgi:hypothetical protein